MMDNEAGSDPNLGPLGVELLAMKNRSELMLDLAYSALLANNRRLAQAVVDLEKWMDEQQFSLQRQALANVASKDIDRALTIIRLAESLEVIGDSAREIADVVLRDVEPHPVLRLATADADANIFQVCIQEASKLVNTSLGQQRLASEVGAWVVAIQRGLEWVLGPDATTTLQIDDKLFVRGPGESRDILTRLADGDSSIADS